MKYTILRSARGILLTCALMLLCTFPLKATGPVTQALLTDYFLRLFPQYSDEDKTTFRMGTLFADIYLLGTIPKEDTYFSGVTLEDIQNEPSPFIAGLKLHSLVEDLRQSFVSQGNYLQLLDNLNIDHSDIYLKFLEDQIIYPSLDKGVWKDASKNILPDELLYNLDEAVLKRWHYLMDLSFSYYPSTLIFLANLKGNGLLTVSAQEVSVWNNTFEATAKRDDIKNYVNALLNMYSSQIKN